MNGGINLKLHDIVLCFSSAMDFIDSAVEDHHKRVAFAAASIAAQLGMKPGEISEIVMAGSLHDIGAFSLRARLDLLSFELNAPHLHAETGYLLLKDFKPFAKAAAAILYHHLPWEERSRYNQCDDFTVLASQALYLADRVAVLARRDSNVLAESGGIVEKIAELSGTKFMPEVVAAFKSVAKREFFWLDLISPGIESELAKKADAGVVTLDSGELEEMARMFCRFIDFRSRFTVTHTAGVAATAQTLAEMFDFPAHESLLVRIAGYLHDLGKLAVPVEIINKPGRLSQDEFCVMKRHTYYTYRVLEKLKGMDQISRYAAFHHEKLNGSGYPFRYSGKEIPAGSRIMAVADVFTALAEDRPYRTGMEKDSIIGIFNEMTGKGELDRHIVRTAIENLDHLDTARRKAQHGAEVEYDRFSSAQRVLS